MIAGEFKETDLTKPRERRDRSAMPDGPLILPRLVSQQATVQPENKADLPDYERGLADGLAREKQAHSDALRVMEAALETLKDQYQTLTSQIETSHLGAIKQYIESLIPAMIGELLSAQVEEMIRLACAQAVHGPVEFSAAPEQQAQLANWLVPHEDVFLLKSDPDLSGLQMRLSWPHGGANFDPKNVRQTCLAHIEAALSKIQNPKT